jgi:hypothetical protein
MKERAAQCVRDLLAEWDEAPIACSPIDVDDPTAAVPRPETLGVSLAELDEFLGLDLPEPARSMPVAVPFVADVGRSAERNSALELDDWVVDEPGLDPEDDAGDAFFDTVYVIDDDDDDVEYSALAVVDLFDEDDEDDTVNDAQLSHEDANRASSPQTLTKRAPAGESASPSDQSTIADEADTSSADGISDAPVPPVEARSGVTDGPARPLTKRRPVAAAPDVPTECVPAANDTAQALAALLAGADAGHSAPLGGVRSDQHEVLQTRSHAPSTAPSDGHDVEPASADAAPRLVDTMASTPLATFTSRPGDDSAQPSSFVDLRVPLSSLMLDPGDELSVADDPDLPLDVAAFIRAYAPLRAYHRVRDDDLEDLVTSMVLRKSLVAGHIIVRPYHVPGDDIAAYVVVDGSRRIAALRWLSEQAASGRQIPHQLETLFESCPVKVVQPGADPALVLAMMGDPAEHSRDPWFRQQHRRVLKELELVAFHDNERALVAATQGDGQVLRRYHTYKALQQMMIDPTVSRCATMKLFPILHEAVGRPLIKEWLDWNAKLFEFTEFDALDRFFAMLVPSTTAAGRVVPPQIASRDDISLLTEVLRSSEARSAFLDEQCTLAEAVEVLRHGRSPAAASHAAHQALPTPAR